ncbi:MAG: hypothetical protein JWO31_2764, partial [Phycisphaerales bacterium]|nr:hypothetical protein [Phycisphaerales bacterium]
DLGAARFGVTGAGVTVGILSDSFDTGPGSYAADVASGDLPSGVRVLKDYPAAASDEGRAMAQLVYDVAPGAGLAFYTAYQSEADFAAGIVALAKPVSQGGAGAKVIVDDVGYSDEPIYQDGIIAQAISTAVNTYGASYFSAAGNSARAAYESAFRPTTATVPGAAGTGTFHDFDPGAGTDVYQAITLDGGKALDLSFQWDQPYASAGGAASASDVNLYLLNAAKTAVVASATGNDAGGDPVELLSYTNPSATAATTVYLTAKLRTGPVPGAMKYVNQGQGEIAAYATNSGTTFGHPTAAAGAGVGAAYYEDTPGFGTTPPVMESFSSAGGTPILFDAAGARLATPDQRPQPRFTSVDGTDTTFFGDDAEGNGLPNFFGTSAAAPHAAAVAALMKQAVPSLTATQIYSAMQSTAADMSAAGYDYDTGYGLVRADQALAAVAGASVAGQVFRDADADGVRDADDPALPGTTVFLDADADGVVDAGSATFANNTATAIPDGGAAAGGRPSRVTSSLAVAGLTGRVTKVVARLSATHTFDNDLEFTLVSPGGVRVPLVSQVQTCGDNFTNTVFDDAAAASIQASTAAPFTGTFRPRTPLSTLAGEDPNGTWKLEARDFFSVDAGSIQSWGLTITYADRTTTADAGGAYAFAGLAPSSTFGAYNVRQVVPAGLTQTSPSAPYNLTLAAGAVAAGRDFGNLAPPPTVLTAAASRKTHGAAGAFDLPLALGTPAGAATVEPRSGGPTTLVLTFSAGVTAADGFLDAGDLLVSNATVADVSVAGATLTLQLTGAVDASTVTVDLSRLADLAGNGLGGTQAVAVRTLWGDANGSGAVNVNDVNLAKSRSGQALSALNYLTDLNASGDVNVNDANIAKSRSGRSVG